MMKKSIFSLQILLVAFVLFLFPAQAADDEADQSYKKMLETSKSMQNNFDFTELRQLYTRTSFYEPYGVSPKEDFKPFFKRAENNDKTVVKDVDAYMAKHFALPEAQTRALAIYQKFEPDKVGYYSWAAKGLIYEILGSGDGKSAQTAYKVVNVPEEYMVARKCIDRVTSQRLEEIAGKNYDVLEGHKSGATINLWFDVTPLLQAKKL